jgi:drug/metabolite transporter (DMT)-like permease
MISLGEISTKIISSPVKVLFLIFISDLLGYGMYYRGLRDVPATIATIFELAFPLTGFMLDYMLYDVTPSPMKVVAALTILMSIVILPHCHFIEEKQEKS